ncbi:hypothetical protein L226DRAFT_612897 [Lentinus tigrinus ALCF2SS1-7]|uniref:Uncharacterized protein n=1 Tax=Lentinus tigrinus ALCF2SS1-6 TaxID=1328759 RepID=A0A5C2SBH2_9APHY|nr:hypothetical protein L227DRAFT_610759 [Lentinus tigrinus ALCF2SS1-6]RPD75270.1 hypothetical protein L226DRAFT_612897 [Lentinus tigrinus ALCF2SS1-7]
MYPSSPDSALLREYAAKVRNPPYVSNEASVRFVEYGPGRLWERYPILMLFTDGVDRIIDGYHTRTGAQGSMDPADVLTLLLGLSPLVKPRVEDILGHKLEIQWNPTRKNRAIDVLGNLLGGTDIDRLKGVIAQTQSGDAGRLQVTDGTFDLDDTTIILCDLTILIYELDQLRDEGERQAGAGRAESS